VEIARQLCAGIAAAHDIGVSDSRGWRKSCARRAP
jgi:hypothetical protein